MRTSGCVRGCASGIHFRSQMLEQAANREAVELNGERFFQYRGRPYIQGSASNTIEEGQGFGGDPEERARSYRPSLHNSCLGRSMRLAPPNSWLPVPDSQPP